MSKLTIPSPRNIKKREAFLLAHPDYYGEDRLKLELSRIIATRVEKKLQWARPTSALAKRIS